jgi:hypothetical protein
MLSGSIPIASELRANFTPASLPLTRSDVSTGLTTDADWTGESAGIVLRLEVTGRPHGSDSNPSLHPTVYYVTRRIRHVAFPL